MRTRDIFVKFWLAADEAENLRAYAEQCELTKSAFTRMLIQGRRPQANPPDEFWQMFNELYEIHDSFRIIADSGVGVSERAREAQKQTAEFILQLQSAVTLPGKGVPRRGDNEDMGG